jgi:hypothetical protein
MREQKPESDEPRKHHPDCPVNFFTDRPERCRCIFMAMLDASPRTSSSPTTPHPQRRPRAARRRQGGDGMSTEHTTEAEHKHPEHRVTDQFGLPVRPIEFSAWWERRREQENCYAEGGHWWHSQDAMIAWFCCVCGKSVDGMPQDGTRGRS